VGTSASIDPARRAIVNVLDNRNIRAIQIAWAAGIAADWAFLVAILVVAYEQGGALSVGLVGLVRMVPATVVALFIGVPRRVSHERALVAINLIRACGALGGAAALLLGWPFPIVVAAAAIIASAGALVRPTQAALLPSLARAPDELVASNVAASTGEGVGTFIGPAAGGLAVVAYGPAVACLGAAVVFLIATIAVGRIRIPAAAADVVGPLRERPARVPVVAGVAALVARPVAGLLMVDLACQVLTRGLLTTLIVVASIELLGLGDGGVGLLNAAIGVGGLVGAIGALTLAGRTQLAPTMALALVGWGLPIAVVGFVPAATVAILAMAVVGISNAVLDVSAFTLLQRTIPNSDRAAVFTLLEGIVGMGLSIGGIIAPVLIAILGIRGALIVTGSLLPLATLLTWRSIRRADDLSVVTQHDLALLRGIPMFGLLPMTILERLAASLEAVTVSPGEVVMREGEPGERYYIVDQGLLEIASDGAVVGTSGPGEGVGEIALLRRVPRTATVTALETSRLYGLDCASFLGAISEHLGNARAAEVVVAERLARSEQAARTG
jgi:hypothetical protein